MAVKTFYFGGREVLSRSSQRCYRVRRTKHTCRLIENLEIVNQISFDEVHNRLLYRGLLEAFVLADTGNSRSEDCRRLTPADGQNGYRQLAFPILEVLDWAGFCGVRHLSLRRMPTGRVRQLLRVTVRRIPSQHKFIICLHTIPVEEDVQEPVTIRGARYRFT